VRVVCLLGLMRAMLHPTTEGGRAYLGVCLDMRRSQERKVLAGWRLGGGIVLFL